MADKKEDSGFFGGLVGEAMKKLKGRRKQLEEQEAAQEGMSSEDKATQTYDEGKKKRK